MNAIQLLREQFNSAHQTQEGTMADVLEKTAQFNKIGKAMPVGAAYAHSVLSEDVLLAMMMTHKKPLSSDFKKIGLSEPMPSMSEWKKYEKWVRTVKIDLAKFRKFAQKVY